MTPPLAFLRYQLSVAREPRLEVRLLQAECLVAAFIGFLLVPLNLLQHQPLGQNIAVLGLALASLWLYRASIQGRHHMKTFSLLLVVVVNLCWFTDGGSQGSMGLFLFVGIVAVAIFFRGWLRWTLLACFLANVVLLYSLDYVHPEWSIPIPGPRERYLEMLTGSVVSLIACLLVLLVLISNHDQEEKQLAAANRQLQQSLAEIQTLQGLLPICAWCKKVRTDQGLWTQVEQYLSERTELSFSHGLCPECSEEHFPNLHLTSPEPAPPPPPEHRD